MTSLVVTQTAAVFAIVCLGAMNLLIVIHTLKHLRRADDLIVQLNLRLRQSEQASASKREGSR